MGHKEIQEMSQQTFGVPATHIVIPKAIIHRGPPHPFKRWSLPACLAFIRSLGVDVQEFKTWCVDKDTGGYRMYFIGSEPTERALNKLRDLSRTH